MIIELDNGFGDIEEIETDRASREKLAEACVTLRDMHNGLDMAWDALAYALTACGLDFRSGGDIEIVIANREKASAWFAKALVEFEAEHTV